MSDNEKNIGSREEFEGKEVKNTMPQLDEEAYNQISEKSKNLRSSMDDDFYSDDDEDYGDEDNDIINSLLEESKNIKGPATLTEETKSKFSFGKKKETSENGEDSPKKSMFAFGKKNQEEVPAVPVDDLSSGDISSSDEINSYGTDSDTEEDGYEEFIPETKEKKSFFGKKEKAPKKEKPKKEKGSLFNKKKKDEPINTNSEDTDFPEDIDDDSDMDSDDGINTIEQIERDIRKSKIGKKSVGGSKKIFVALGALFVILILLIAGMFILGEGDETPQQPVEQTPTAPIETPEENSDFEKNETDAVSYKQGIIKRILGNKILIAPDGETENTIYYIDNMDVVANFKAGNHIEYGYVFKDYLPYVTEIIQINTGTVAYKGIMTINIMVDDTLVKFSYAKELEEEIKEIATGDTLQYVYETIENIPTITNIIDVKKGDGSNVQGEHIDTGNNPMTDNLYNGYVYNKEDFYDEYILIENRGEEDLTRTRVKSNIVGNTIEFYSGLTGPIWIRHAWRNTELIKNAPSIESVDVKLVLPDGTEITHKNIDEYGRMWIDGSIINWALKDGVIGEFKIIDNKPNGTFLGEASVHVMELSGFITISKFGANLIDRNTLELIWNVTGVPDDGMEIEVYLSNDQVSTLIYSGSSKKEVLHTVDKRTVSIANLPKGKYNILVTVKDIDLKTQADNIDISENTIVVAAETIKHTANMGILILQ